MKAGETVVEFDPYDAEREAADGQADLDAGARQDREGARRGRRRPARRSASTATWPRSELDRAETFQLTDEELFSRHQIIESQLDRELFEAKADVAERKLAASGKLSSAERALGRDRRRQGAAQGAASRRRACARCEIQAPHDGLLVLERNWRGEMPSVGDTLWPGQKVAEVPDLLEARGRASSCSRPTARASRRARRRAS